jgi:hypothetical protein
MPKRKHLPSREGGALPSGSETTNHKTQHQHILDLLMAADGAEVPLTEIMVCAAQYNCCIHQLRKRGYKIVNRSEIRNGVTHSWYRLESSPAEPMPGTRKKNARPEAQAEAAPPSYHAQARSLFPEMEAPATTQPVWRDPELGALKNGSQEKGSVRHG